MLYKNSAIRKPSGLRYVIGSLTKIFTATLVAKLLDKGSVNLSGKQSLLDGEIEVKIPSVLELLTHTSGLKQQPFTQFQNLVMFASVLSGGKACVENPFVGKSSKEQIFHSLKKSR